MEPEVKVDPLFIQDHINVHKSNLESNPNENLIVFGDTFKLLPPMFHDSLFRNLIDQLTSTHNDVPPIVSSGNQEWSGIISHVEEKSVEYVSYLSSLSQDDNLVYMVNLQPFNIGTLKWP